MSQLGDNMRRIAGDVAAQYGIDPACDADLHAIYDECIRVANAADANDGNGGDVSSVLGTNMRNIAADVQAQYGIDPTLDADLQAINADCLRVADEADSHVGDGGGTDPPPWNGTCPQYPKTLKHEFDWSVPGNMLCDTVKIGYVQGGVLVASFTTPDKPGYDGALMHIGVAEFPGDQAQVTRTICVSANAPACDLKVPAGYSAQCRAGTGSMYLAYGDDSPFGYGRIEPNTKYYVVVANVNDADPNQPNAPNGGAEFRLEMNKPPGI